jgi:heme ABC exporter ATP-binding subunit CcmA
LNAAPGRGYLDELEQDLMSRAPAVDVTALARRFGRRWILRGVDLRIEPGSAVALVGRNGSGKTTLLRVLCTILRPHRGTARVFGFDVLEDSDRVREHVGLLGHAPGLYDDLTATENVSFALRMMGAEPDARIIRDTLADVGLAAHAQERARGFSAGMRRRLGLARLLVRPPRLLMLDEPYASFDQEGIDRVNLLIRAVVTAGGAALVATHDLQRTRGVVERVVRIADGKLVPHDAPDPVANPAAEWQALEGGAA